MEGGSYRDPWPAAGLIRRNTQGKESAMSEYEVSEQDTTEMTNLMITILDTCQQQANVFIATNALVNALGYMCNHFTNDPLGAVDIATNQLRELVKDNLGRH
jgi:hypothetical protein